MKFKTDHNAYEPVFAQLAELLDSDFTIKYDSSDEPLGISATVVDKTGVIGFNISTHLGKNPEWRISSFYDIPFSLNDMKSGSHPSYKFIPAGVNSKDFPILTKDQIDTIKTKLKSIYIHTLAEIKTAVKKINGGVYTISGDYIRTNYEDGFKSFNNFESIGMQVDPAKFFLGNVNKITHKLIQGLAKSNNQNLVALAPIAAKLYLSNLKINKFSTPNMLTAISDLRTKDDVDKIYLTEDVQNYLIELIKQYVETALTTERSYLLVTIIRLYEDITKVASELKVFAYELTGDSTWLPKDVSDLFLF